MDRMDGRGESYATHMVFRDGFGACGVGARKKDRGGGRNGSRRIDTSGGHIFRVFREIACLFFWISHSFKGKQWRANPFALL